MYVVQLLEFVVHMHVFNRACGQLVSQRMNPISIEFCNILMVLNRQDKLWFIFLNVFYFEALIVGKHLMLEM